MEWLKEAANAVSRVVSEGRIGGTDEAAALEAEWASMVGVPYAVSVSSGTSGLEAALLAVGVRPGDHVIVPAVTFTASALAVHTIGANAVFVDVDPETGLLDVDALRKVQTSRPAAIVVVDIDGRLPDYREIASLDPGVPIIEDACPSLGSYRDGAQAGQFGAISVFSLNHTKMVGAGEGGLVTTRSKALAERVRSLRNFGEDRAALSDEGRRISFEVGRNWKLSELPAAFARVNLRHSEYLGRRARRTRDALREAAARSKTFRKPAPFAQSEDPRPHKVRLHLARGVFRSEALLRLESVGVPTMPLAVEPLSAHPAFGGSGASDRFRFPNAYRFYDESIIIGSRTQTPWSVSDSDLQSWCTAIQSI